ncbi:MAG TPA: hypothetical protein VJJ52_04960 [Candidatus Nanoarchaeia archaeon]|nr:hypothetical protein [Candidatus Nanoarchaeia archaeon]
MKKRADFDRELNEYIKKQLKNGHDEKSIRKVMLKCGYDKPRIDFLFQRHYTAQKTQKYALAAMTVAFLIVFSLVFPIHNKSDITAQIIKQEQYQAKTNTSNSPPLWQGESIFYMNTSLTLNLSQFFIDPESDKLIFNIASEPILNESIKGNIVIFADNNGTWDNISTIVTAYDGWNLVTKEINIVHQNK